MTLEDPRVLWEHFYWRMEKAGQRPTHDPWLARWMDTLAHTGTWPILELGCGSGEDARWMLDAGLHVIAGDYAPTALKAAREIAPDAHFIQLDLRDGLPFATGHFRVIVAGLCLHYFRHAQTRTIIGELARCLSPEGHILARFNSIHDNNYGAVGHKEVERGCYLVNGELKRFFDHDDVAQLFDTGWHIHNLEEVTIHRYRHPKVVWEVVAAKMN